MKLSVSFLSLSLILQNHVKAYTWPSYFDELEDIMYLQSGMLHRGFRDGVLGCTLSTSGDPSRQDSAEWLRTSFHDAITHDKSTGKGGLDASIMYELDRAENAGPSTFNDTFGFMSGFQSVRASMADLIALGVYTVAMECGGPVIPFRAGRIDATEAGESGVPEPTTDLETTKKQFEKAGFNETDMIAMVACGHTLGGVHRTNFPNITNQDVARFDNTTGSFDNQVVNGYLGGDTTNPLVVGPDASNSDMRVFSSDGNATMQSLADPSTFKSRCASILQRMIDTVPSTVTLTDPIQPIDIKPSRLGFALDSTGSVINFNGWIRVRMTERGDTAPETISMSLVGDQGEITATQERFQGGVGSGFNGEWFQFYKISYQVPSNTTMTAFNVHVNGETFTNGGNGFPMLTEILSQPEDGCISFGDDTARVKIVAAVRNDRSNLPTYVNLAAKKHTQGVVPVKFEVQKLDMTNLGPIGDSGYDMFSANVVLPSSDAGFTTYDLVNDNITLEFQSTSLLPQC